jgi:hypothetical protein
MNKQIQLAGNGDPMKRRLQRAVESQKAPAQLEMKIRLAIRRGVRNFEGQRSHLWIWLIPSAGLSVLAAVALIAVRLSSSHGIEGALPKI